MCNILCVFQVLLSSLGQMLRKFSIVVVQESWQYECNSDEYKWLGEPCKVQNSQVWEECMAFLLESVLMK